MMGCGGCNHIETSPHTLRTGRVVCSTCRLVTEEAATIQRHAMNLDRCPGRDARRDYLMRVKAMEGDLVARDVEAAYLAEWKKKQGVA